jgi:hypothetical protein
MSVGAWLMPAHVAGIPVFPERDVKTWMAGSSASGSDAVLSTLPGHDDAHAWRHRSLLRKPGAQASMARGFS